MQASDVSKGKLKTSEAASRSTQLRTHTGTGSESQEKESASGERSQELNTRERSRTEVSKSYGSGACAFRAGWNKVETSFFERKQIQPNCVVVRLLVTNDVDSESHK